MLRYWRFFRISLGLVAAVAVIATRGSTVLSVAAAGEQRPSSLRTCPAVTDRVLSVDELSSLVGSVDASARWRPYRVSLAPAQWIWLPSQRTLPSTFVLFRREIELSDRPRKAAGWITADSRYRLTVNGTRVQWGPPPCDPRQLDVDPVDVTSLCDRART